MSNLVISVLRLPPELFWDDDPATRSRHETFRRLAADRVEYLEARVEACSARNSSDADRIAELEREVALSRDMLVNAENLVSAAQTDYYKARRRIVELERVLREATDDLESEIEARRPGELDRRIENDLDIVREARALLTQEEGGAR